MQDVGIYDKFLTQIPVPGVSRETELASILREAGTSQGINVAECMKDLRERQEDRSDGRWDGRWQTGVGIKRILDAVKGAGQNVNPTAKFADEFENLLSNSLA